MPGLIGRREREPVSLEGSVTLPSGRSIAVTVTNLSPEGCCVESGEILPIPANVQLELGGGVSSAHVRWALPGKAGLQLR